MKHTELTLSRTDTSDFSCVLEPFVDGVTVEVTPHGSMSLSQSTNEMGIIIPPKTEDHTTWVYLRPDDVINFADQGLKISVTIKNDPGSPPPNGSTSAPPAHAVDAMTTSEYGTPSETVQIKSSIAEPTDVADVHLPVEQDEDTADDDGDLDRELDARSPQTTNAAGASTPVRTEPTIKETPSKVVATTLASNSEHLEDGSEDVDSTAGAQILTSEALTPREACDESANRTINAKSARPAKRARSELADGTDNDGGSSSQKKRKTSSQRSSSDSEDEEADNASHASLSNSKASIDGTEVHAPTQESEGITVSTKKLRSSPEVHVHTKARTPSSSAPSSTPTGKALKILLSSDIKLSATLKKFLKKRTTIIDDVPSKKTNFVCVVPKAHSLKSAKVLHSLAMNKNVVTDNWLQDWKAQGLEDGECPNPLYYIHDALEDTVTHDRSRVFGKKNLFFTAAVVDGYKKGWADIQAVAKEAGALQATKVDFGKPAYLQDREDFVFFAGAQGDNDVGNLIKEGCTVYSKEMFTQSIICGELQLLDKYKLGASTSARKGRRST